MLAGSRSSADGQAASNDLPQMDHVTAHRRNSFVPVLPLMSLGIKLEIGFAPEHPLNI
jgi:hypothetical protein